MSTAVFEVTETIRPQVSNSPQQISSSAPQAFPSSVPASNTTAASAPPEAVLTQMITGSLGSQAVYVAAKLGIADLLADGPKNVDELAPPADADAPSLYRVLRALASFRRVYRAGRSVFELNADRRVVALRLAASLRDLAIFIGEDWHWQVWGQTLYSVRTGQAGWSQVHGQEVFPYFAANPRSCEDFRPRDDQPVEPRDQGGGRSLRLFRH